MNVNMLGMSSQVFQTSLRTPVTRPLSFKGYEFITITLYAKFIEPINKLKLRDLCIIIPKFQQIECGLYGGVVSCMHFLPVKFHTV